MYKRDIINFLFIISFPVYGIGTYISAISSPSVGYFISISPHILIILFYSIDLLYKGEFEIRLNKYYFFMLLFILSATTSLFIALRNGLPEAKLTLTITKSFLLIIPFHSFLLVTLYNYKRVSMLKLTLLSLSLLLAINLAGYFGGGLSNGTHSLEGRLNFPFLEGIYSGACLLAIINLLLLYYLKRHWANPIRFVSFGAYFLFNLILFFLINSRLTILIFVLVVALCLIGMIRMRGIYVLSMFTIPILLGSGLLIYEVLQLPGFSSMMQRVDIEDVTTFNGRAFLWQDAMDWLLKDGEGLLLGNGYKGHYFLGLIDDVARLWNEEDIHHMHLHSTSMEILVCQGVIFFIIFAALFYMAHDYYRTKHIKGKEEGAFLPVIVFLLFIMQVDNFVYLDGLGFVIFSLLVSPMAIKQDVKVWKGARRGKQKEMVDQILLPYGLSRTPNMTESPST